MAKSVTSFKPGKSGNPGGRPKGVAAVRALAQEYTAEALGTLHTIMQDDDAPASARVTAANALLDRGWGRAPQTIADDEGSPVAVKDISPLEAARQIAFMLAAAAHEADEAAGHHGDYRPELAEARN